MSEIFEGGGVHGGVDWLGLAGGELQDGGDEAAGLAVSGEDLAEVLVGDSELRGGGAVAPAHGMEVLAGGGDGAGGGVE